MNREEFFQALQAVLQQQTLNHERQMAVLLSQLRKPADEVDSWGRGVPKLNIPNFSGFSKDDIKSWLFLANQNLDAAGVSEKKKVAVISGYLRDSALQWFRSVQTPDMLWEEFQERIIKSFQPGNYQNKLRMELDMLKQGKEMSTYITRFMEIMNQVETMSEIDKIHYFTKGLSPKTRAEVGYSSPISLEQAIRVAADFDSNYFGKNLEYYPNHHSKNNQYSSNSGGKGIRMGRYQERSKEGSEDKGGYRCYICKKQGHKANECYSRHSTQKHNQEKTGKVKEINHVRMTHSENDRPTSIIIHVNRVPLECILDTGASRSIISKEAVEKYNFEKAKTDLLLTTANGETFPPEGITKELMVRVFDTYQPLEMIITNITNHEVLLGLDWFKATGASYDPSKQVITFPKKSYNIAESTSIGAEDLDNHYIDTENVLLADLSNMENEMDEDIDQEWTMLKSNKVSLDNNGLSDEETQRLETFLNENKSAFAKDLNDLGTCNLIKHKIIINTNVNPIYLSPYRKAAKEREIINAEVQKMLAANIIRPSKSPWSFPVILVPKHDGSKRFCVDYRELNKISITDHFPLPRIDDILDRFSGSKIFTKIDLKSGYWQIMMDKASIEKTAFTTPDGHYEFLRLPFGIKNAPAEFSRIMKILLGHLSFVEVYLDDITIHSKNFDGHLHNLKAVFDILKENQLKLNYDKCIFAVQSIKLLGHIISGEGIKMDHEKIKVIEELKAPNNVKDLQKILGITGYYRKFIKNYADISAPLYNLLKKDTIFTWDGECKKAFEELKSKLVSYPILRAPDLGQPFIIYTDASNLALGAILSQLDEQGNEFVCSYASRLLKGAEVHYGITEKECLALVWSIKLFRPYLYMNKFKVVTDHAALKWLLSIKGPTGRLARWSIYLQAYDFEIVHRAGSAHSNVDALSRPVYWATISRTDEADKDTDTSSKSLDVWEDGRLLFYLRHKRHEQGLPKRQVKRVQKLALQYRFEKEKLLIKKDDKHLEVPKIEERGDLILKTHLLGHFQAETVMERLKTKFYWKGMLKDIKNIIRKCLPCLRNHVESLKEHPAKALSISKIFERVGIDLILGLPETIEGFNGILVITEYLTKYPMVFPIKSKSAAEIANNLFHYVSIFGPPKELLSDQGKEFLNETINELLKLSGIERKVTSSYSPRTNGLTERFNKTLISSLRVHAENEPTTWHEWLPFVNNEENSSNDNPIISFIQLMSVFHPAHDNKKNMIYALGVREPYV